MTAVQAEPSFATSTWEALGTTALVRVDDPAALEPARAIVAAELDAIDLAASRFRNDSELERINAADGRLVPISPLLHEAIEVALDAAEITDGAVDPTLGEAMRLAGYVCDWGELQRRGDDGVPAPPAVSVRRLGGWEQVELVDDPPAVIVPAGLKLDLGATAKALSADRAAAAVAAATGIGVLVSLGGDIATAGRVPVGGWHIHVTDDHRSDPSAPGQTVAIFGGALATSSTTTRRWRRAGEEMHHILDPQTGAPAQSRWRTVSVTAGSCVEANTASTAAIVFGTLAPAWLAERGLAARLVANEGDVVRVGGWPA
jgi:thiamine biosynthesis lipoprotein